VLTVILAITAVATAYTEVVRGMSGFFQESPEAGPLELHRYVTGLQLPKRYPGVQALGFAERVRARDLDGFERRIKVELRLSGLPHPPLHVTPRPSTGELVVASRLESADRSILQEPLRTVTAYTGLLERRLGERLEDKERSWLGFIGGAAQHMSHLIADLLEYSRAGTRQSEPEAVDLDDAWDEAVRHLAGAIDDAGATVVRGDLPVVQAARRDMTSMLQNLLGNAIKYRRDGVPPVVRAEAMRRNGRWELLIEDNGIGIEPRFHDRVFGLFQRLHTSEEYPGTGMGLAIVRKLAEANGGTVSVRSSPGQGSTFVVALPSAEEQA
jgi:signal transduction histidine kinase